MEYITIAKSGYIPELKISVQKGQCFKVGHPYAKALLPYSTTPRLLEDLALQSSGKSQEAPESTGKNVSLSQKEEEELRQMAKEAGIKQWKNMKIENIIKKLEDLNNE